MHNSQFWTIFSSLPNISCFLKCRVGRGTSKYQLRTSPTNGTASLTTPFVHATASIGVPTPNNAGAPHLFVKRGKNSTLKICCVCAAELIHLSSIYSLVDCFWSMEMKIWAWALPFVLLHGSHLLSFYCRRKEDALWWKNIYCSQRWPFRWIRWAEPTKSILNALPLTSIKIEMLLWTKWRHFTTFYLSDKLFLYRPAPH